MSEIKEVVVEVAKVFLKKYSLGQTAEAPKPSLSESRHSTRTSWEAGAQSSRHLCSSENFRFASDPKATVAAANETPQERHFERIAEQIVDIPVPEMTPTRVPQITE